jgi:hypothetical protein
MEEYNPKQPVISAYPMYKPISRRAFEKNRETILSGLFSSIYGVIPENDENVNQVIVPILNNC